MEEYNFADSMYMLADEGGNSIKKDKTILAELNKYFTKMKFLYI